MTPRTNRLKLLFASALIAATWLVVLPRLSRWAPIRSMIQAHEAAGIDPSAMFYSDLEHHSFQDGMLRRTP